MRRVDSGAVRYGLRRAADTLSGSCPERTTPIALSSREEKLERAKGFEPSTPTLARSCSTPELHPHPSESISWRGRGFASTCPKDVPRDLATALPPDLAQPRRAAASCLYVFAAADSRTAFCPA